ncbi:hypothetical protein JW935_29050 [candidate division KSB1 bacterium]|nr:hypothetical protein [candidate division KSB1 bacterium]
MLKRYIFIPLVFLFFSFACKQTTEHVETKGAVQGTVSCLLPVGAVAIHPAWIFSDTTYLATTDAKGWYRITGLERGTHTFTGSALFCGDTTLSVVVQGGRTITLDFLLKPDSTTGKVYGEFQDGTLFQQRLQEDSSLANWSDKQIFDAATGATLQYKALKDTVADRAVLLGDSVLTIADAWGQYWFTIPSGTYPLTGSCDGYKNVTQVFRVEADSRNYLNFILPRQGIIKAR